jgi:hypothetical protein
MESEFNKKFKESAKHFFEKYPDLKGLIGYSDTMMYEIEEHPEREDSIVLNEMGKQMVFNSQLLSAQIDHAIKKNRKIKIPEF